MKKKFLIIFAMLISVGCMSACTQNENVSDTTTATAESSAVAVSQYEGKIKDISNSETSSVSQETASSGMYPTEETNADTGKDLTEENQNTTTRPIEKTTTPQKAENTKPTTPKATEIPTQKPTQPIIQKTTVEPTESISKEKIDMDYVVSECIAYGKSLGMIHTSSMNTENSSWFSPNDADYYDNTQSFLNDCYGEVDYVTDFLASDDISPSDICFNVVSIGSRLYVVYG